MLMKQGNFYKEHTGSKKNNDVRVGKWLLLFTVTLLMSVRSFAQYTEITHGSGTVSYGTNSVTVTPLGGASILPECPDNAYDYVGASEGYTFSFSTPVTAVKFRLVLDDYEATSGSSASITVNGVHYNLTSANFPNGYGGEGANPEGFGHNATIYNACTIVFDGALVGGNLVSVDDEQDSIVITGSISSVSIRSNGTANGDAYFNFYIPAPASCSTPTISSVSPAVGINGTAVTITGTNFNTTAANDVVYFGATAAPVTSASATSLSVTVPAEALFAPVTVNNTGCGLTGFSTLPFLPTYTPTPNTYTNFDPNINVTANFAPEGVAISDLDGDGLADVVVANNFFGTLSVLQNTGTPGTISFTAQPELSLASGANAFGVAIADIDGDGKPDIVATDNANSQVSVFINSSTVGNFSFVSRSDFATGFGPEGVTIADMDGDGKPDIIVANYFDGTISILHNASVPGTILFAPQVPFTPSAPIIGVGPLNITTGDLNGDGLPDVVTTNAAPNVISVFQNTSTVGVISLGASVDLVPGAASTLNSVAIADIDGDGKQDILFGDQGSNNLYIIQNVNTGGSITGASFAPAVAYTVGNGPTSIAIGDINGDGKPDVVASNNIDNTVSVLLNTATSGTIDGTSLATHTEIPSGGSQLVYIAVGDLDGDGLPDVAVVDNYGTDVVILRNDPIVNTAPTFLNSSPQPLSVCVNSTGTDITAMLHVSDIDIPQTETWTVVSGPDNGGTLSGFSSANIAISGSTDIAPGNTVSYTPSGTFTGVESFTIQVTDGIATAQTVFSVTVNALPSIDAGSNQAICADGTSTATLNATGTSTDYSWAGNGLLSNSGPSVTAQPTVTATYTVTGTLNGCSNTATVTVSVNQLPSAITYATNEGCMGTTMSFSDPDGPGTWTTSDNSVATIASDGTLTAITDGGISITYTNPSTNCFVSAPVNIGLRPVAAFVSSPGATTCAGTEVTYSTYSSGFSSYTWTVSGTEGVDYTVTSGNTGSSSSTFGITWTSTGTQTVTLNFADDLYGCTSVDNAVSSTNVVTPPAIMGNLNICGTGTNVLSDADGAGTWLASNANVNTDNSGNITGASLGTSIITYTDGINNCQAYVTVTVNPLASPVSGNALICGTSTIMLSDVDGSGSWTSSNGSGSVTVDASGNVTGVSAGTAMVTYASSADGCTASTTVLVNASPSAGSITGPASVLLGGTINLTDAAGGWATHTDMSTAMSLMATAVVNDNIYVMGGQNATSCNTTVQVYNTTSDTWSSASPMPGCRYEGDGAGVVNGKIYVPGGWNIPDALPETNLYIYDPSTDNWTSGSPMPGRSANGITGVINNILYVTTAANGSSGYRDFLYSYDPTLDSWSTLNSSPSAHASPAGGVINGKLYVAGGNDASGNPTAQLDVYDPLTGNWTTKASMPVALFDAVSGVMNGKLYVIGGYDGTTKYNTIYIYDPLADAWSTGPAAAQAIWAGAGAVASNSLYVIGGLDATSTVLTTNQSFTPYSWSSSNTAVATVDQSGAVAGIAGGTATISFTTGGECTSFATQDVTVLGQINGTLTVCQNSSTSLSDAAAGGTWSTTSDNASVDGSGNVTGITAGTAVITYLVSTSTVTATVTVNASPAIVLGTIPAVCQGATVATLSYSNPVVFNYTGGAQVWTVPSDVTAITFDVDGASGGHRVGGTGTPGKGGRVTGTLSVTPGETLNIFVGGNGGTGSSTGAVGGYNGGGNSYNYGGSGGGASDIRVGGVALLNRVVVAGGGGGGAADGASINGGDGGGLTGANGGPNPNSGTSPAGGGTQSLGGVGADYPDWGTGTAGDIGVGGAGLNNVGSTYSAGGGAGYYGGGGGVWSGGGGGSSYTDPITVSSFTHTQGYQSGNGIVSLSYPYPVTTTYSIVWNSDATDAGFTNVTAGALSGSPITITVPVGAPANTYTGTFTINNGSCTSTSQTITVTVNPLPDVSGYSNQAVCSNMATATVTFTGSVTPTTYSWTNSNSTIGLASSGTGSIPSFTVTNSGTTPAIATITVVPTANGCTGPAQNFTLTVNPTPTVSVPDNEAVCNGGTTGDLNFGGTVTGTTYTWTNTNNTIGLVSTGAGSSIPSFTVTNGGASPAIATITVLPSANSCNGLTQSFTLTVNPTPTVSVPENAAICNSNTTGDLNFNGTVDGTTYTWTNTNSTIGLALTGTGSSIPSFTVTNSGTVPVTATITVLPSANGCNGLTQSFTLTVNPTPTVSVPENATICNGSTTGDLNFNGTVGGTTYTWTNTNNSIGLASTGAGSSIPSFTVTNSGTSPAIATITVLPSANGCNGLTQSFMLTVNPTPTVSVPENAAVCNGNATGDLNFNGTVDGTTYTWTNDNSTIGLALTGTGSSIPSFTVTNSGTSPVTANITVSPSANGCPGSSQIFTLTINPTPTVSVPENAAICNGGTTGDLNFNGTVDGTTYTWTNTNTTIGLASTGAGSCIPSFTVTNSGTSPVTATITVLPSANGCNGLTQSFTLTVNPTPNVSVPENAAVCNGNATGDLNFNGTVDGTTYTWTNDNSTIGLASTGAGNSIPSFTVTNSGTSPVTANITVSPSANGCPRSSQIFTLTVNPTPTVTVPDNEAICNGATTGDLNFGGTVDGTTYTWINDNATIGLASTGAGSIPSFTVTNGGTAPVIADITVLPSANGCPGLTQSFTLTVNPTPTVIVPENEAICNGGTTGDLNFGGAVSGTTYTWVNTNTTIGLASTGSGSSIPSFTVTNGGTSPVTAIITVLPAANGCNGITQGFTLTINPTPTVTVPENEAVCNGGTTGDLNFSGAVSGTTYTWINDNATIGLASTGAGSIPSFTVTNSGTSPVTADITVLPSANGCPGLTQSFTLTVNPTPTVIVPGNEAVCNGFATGDLNFSGAVSGTTYAWTNTNSTIGLASSGTGSIPSFTVTNSGTDPVTATITVLPSANGCDGLTQSFILTVNPTPMLNSTLTPADICDSTLFVYIPGSLTGGTSYAWHRPFVTGISVLSASGVYSVSETLVNNTPAPIAVTYVYTLTANGCTNIQDVTFNVNPKPLLSSPLTNAICDSQLFHYHPTSGTSGSTYTWVRPYTEGIYSLAGSGTGNIDDTLINTTNDNVTITYTYSITANGCSDSEHVMVTVHPTPTLSTPTGPFAICSGQTFYYSAESLTPTTTFTWARTAITGILPATASDTVGSISETLTNSLMTPGYVTYLFTLSAYGCSHNEAVDLTVNAKPDAAVITTAVSDVCDNTFYQNFGAATNPPSYETYAWSATGATIVTAGSDGQYSLVNFTTAGDATVTLTVTIDSTGCNNSSSFVVHVGTSDGTQPNVIYSFGEFICLENDVTSYQWGYDNKQTLDSTILVGQINQSYANSNPDTVHNYYWVIANQGGCQRKAYYNGPLATTGVAAVSNSTDVKIYPNPTSDYLNVDITTTIDGAVQIEVMDMLGQKIGETAAMNNKALIDVSKLASGCYIVNCYREGIKIAGAKFIKN